MLHPCPPGENVDEHPTLLHYTSNPSGINNRELWVKPNLQNSGVTSEKTHVCLFVVEEYLYTF